MAYQNQIKVTVKTVGGATLVFDDAVSAGAGGAALTSLEAGRTIQSVSEGKVTIVPFSSVDNAVVENTRTTVNDPVDANCN